ncbi:MAG: hypothetical protein ACLFVG_02130 [Candidatus Aminicenantes bacterium]
MAGFEGVKWASQQMRYMLGGKKFDLLEHRARVFSVSRSIHYGMFLCFDGIRFFCKKNGNSQLEVVLLNWHKNLERFSRGIAFNLAESQQQLVPTVDELEDVFIQKYFKDSSMRSFFEQMASEEAQGYFRPFTVDEDLSIGVTFPENPSIRAVVCRFERYLGEPFTGVVVPHLVRAVGVNQTGCLKLGVNYLMSFKAVDAARKIYPRANSALFLDDRPYAELEERVVTEWDSSCCLFGFRDGTVVKIPESSLILPSVTIQGMMAILKERGVKVEEKDIPYGDLINKVKDKELVVACSVGTAGILNRCQKLILADEKGKTIATHQADQSHKLFRLLGEVKKHYWDIYRGKADAPQGIKLSKYKLP